MKIILNLLGILIYFLNRFINRRGKNKTFSITFWLKDNWPELLVVLLMDISLMILLLTNDVTIDLAGFIPDWMVAPGDLTLVWLVGLGLASLVYTFIKKKFKTTTP